MKNDILRFISFTLKTLVFYFLVSFILIFLFLPFYLLLNKFGVLNFVNNLLGINGGFWKGFGTVPWLVFSSVIGTLIIITVLMVSVIVNVWIERKLSAKIQGRMGPTLINIPFLLKAGSKNMWLGGIIQPIADVIKLIQKEIMVPQGSYPFLFILSPVLAFVTVVIAFGMFPFSNNYILLNQLDVGLLFIFAVSSYMVLSLVIAAWASNNKYSLLGGLRTVAQMLSYEIPLLLSFLSVTVFTGSFKIVDIVNFQNTYFWLVFYQPLMFIIFLWSMVAENNRAPFDLPEAESELVAGFVTEYSSMAFALFYLAEYGYLFFNSAIIATIFLGGYSLIPHSLLNAISPVLQSWGIYESILAVNDNFIWIIFKTFLIVGLIMFFRWTYPRIRIDHLMDLAWKAFIPITLIHMLLASVDVLLFKSQNVFIPLFSWIIFAVVIYLASLKNIKLSNKYKNVPKYT
ncbi:MAG: complex I subunit 1 family protein [Candidatus Calescibacterium sp.]|nr:NADH-quinone oxidoreductase subunit H [Candidatus Calescibacterium sp.]MDW8132710.1 complex I subunit 1 family protein [Candidatus Calescibacterium sp.]